MSNAQIKIASGFKRTDPAIVNGHPLRGTLKTKLQREHLLRTEVAPERTKIVVIRDTLISLMGAVSAMVPLFVAFQSVMGA